MGLLIGICAVLLVVMVGSVTGNVVLMGRNVSRSFDDIEATFTPKVKGPGESGILYLAEPLDACKPLTNKVVGGSKSHFVLIIRGICSFDDKVRRAQNAGFRAAIIYDYEDDSPLVAMGGTPGGVEIHAVFISKVSGTVLKQYAGLTDIELWILPTVEHPTWSIMAISFISLLALSAMVVTCCFVRQHEGNEISRVPQVQEFNGMSRRMVKAMPSLIFTTVLDDTCTSVTCAICLEDYKAGEKLRILPCRHKFHAICVDSWLTSWRTFCPMCKRDARTNIPIPPPSESTPLLSSVSPSPASTLLSFHSPIATSPPVPIISTPPWLPSPSSRNHSLSSTHRLTNSYKSCNNSHGIYINQSSADLRNVNSSQRSHTSHFMSPRSVGMPVSSPYGSRYIYPYNPSSSNASPSYLAGSSSRPSYLRHCESGASISALASAQSLPSC